MRVVLDGIGSMTVLPDGGSLLGSSGLDFVVLFGTESTQASFWYVEVVRVLLDTENVLDS